MLFTTALLKKTISKTSNVDTDEIWMVKYDSTLKIYNRL